MARSIEHLCFRSLVLNICISTFRLMFGYLVDFVQYLVLMLIFVAEIALIMTIDGSHSHGKPLSNREGKL